jgi:hypothetical protein
MALLRHHEETLAEIGSQLPGTEEIASLASPSSQSHNPWLPRRILVVMSWHQAYCDLYRLLLSGYPEAAPDVVLEAVDEAELASVERQCLHHASSSLQIISTLNQFSTSHQLLEFDTAICAYHAARLLLFLSRFGRDTNRPSPEFAASRADLCLAALKRFFPSSLLVSPIVTELERSIAIYRDQEQGRGVAVPPQEMLDSPPDLTRKGNPESQLSSAARARQKLAIHSLLRQADFLDEDDEDDEEQHPIGPPTLHTTATSQNITKRMDDVGGNSNWRHHNELQDLTSPRDHSQASNSKAVPTPIDAFDTTIEGGHVSPESIQLPHVSWYGPQDWDWLESTTL